MFIILTLLTFPIVFSFISEVNLSLRRIIGLILMRFKTFIRKVRIGGNFSFVRLLDRGLFREVIVFSQTNNQLIVEVILVCFFMEILISCWI